MHRFTSLSQEREKRKAEKGKSVTWSSSKGNPYPFNSSAANDPWYKILAVRNLVLLHSHQTPFLSLSSSPKFVANATQRNAVSSISKRRVSYSLRDHSRRRAILRYKKKRH
ncbi:hypothetical protein VNO78_09021 [Psophocarpus tetragonolobus]|uniref:Uncharacterized protein n=1 Tax=Psophocarpus tetragonolobus TaxID=3891 RepID=A0AAN9SVU7_PSOTE